MLKTQFILKEDVRYMLWAREVLLGVWPTAIPLPLLSHRIVAAHRCVRSLPGLAHEGSLVLLQPQRVNSDWSTAILMVHSPHND